jgi:hypothetical protein
MNDYYKSIDWPCKTKFVQGISYKRLIQILLSACMHFYDMCWIFMLKIMTEKGTLKYIKNQLNYKTFYNRKECAEYHATWPVTISHFCPEAGSSNNSSRLAPHLGVTEFTIVTDMILVTHGCATYVWLGCSTNRPLVQYLWARAIWTPYWVPL